jgi:PIN domain nuclease of toxin-antitoxin system
MTYLLDTHALLFWLFGDRRLSARASGLISDPENKLLVSSASGWEIATKHRLGKLSGADALVSDIAGWVEKAGFVELPILLVHAQRAGSWETPHRDPFDRMLAAQSAIESVPLITSDAALASFGIATIW